jgi:hypothetical protein
LRTVGLSLLFALLVRAALAVAVVLGEEAGFTWRSLIHAAGSRRLLVPRASRAAALSVIMTAARKLSETSSSQLRSLHRKIPAYVTAVTTLP